MGEALVEIKNLKKYFTMKKRLFSREHSYLQAVDDVDLAIMKGETVGLVGESGCGKNTVGRTILRLYEPTDGEIFFSGENIARISQKDMLPYRKRMQIIFQDPYASLDPRLLVKEIISEGMDKSLTKREVQKKVAFLLSKVGLNSEHANRFPHEFSGGQRQRIGIARALAVEPEFIVCDEPISALDVSIQAQVVNMLEELQDDFGLTYLFIAHDISMVKHISDRIAVMYLGKIVEVAESNELYNRSVHPYTQALLSSVPIPDPVEARQSKRIILQGDVPSPIDIPPGCRFRSRCRYAMEICGKETPVLEEIDPGHFVACYLTKK